MVKKIKNMIIKYFDKQSMFTVVLFLIIVYLFFMSNGFEDESAESASGNAYRVKAKVLSVDNSLIQTHGIIKTGAQKLTLRVQNGRFKGEIIEAWNEQLGKLELDKFFAVNDKAFVVLETTEGKIDRANVIDHYRINIEAFLFIIFTILVVFIAGRVGAKSIMTFVFTTLFIWKILLPSFLHGYDPIWVSLICILILTCFIIFTITGLNKKGIVAFLGAASGIIITCILSIIFGKLFKIHGSVRPFAETLLYTGFSYLKITKVFLAGVFIASSGAVMDVAVDISAAMHEVISQNPKITMREAVKSGLEVGKAVIGTMTTTLLLAYSGGYTAMFMVFIAQRTPALNILNIQYVAAEILHTLVGSFGLATVAPLTAMFGGLIYLKKAANLAIEENDS